MPTVVAAPDKLRGTATAAEMAAAIARGATAAGWVCDEAPVSDGGEGLLDVLGGPNRRTVVTGPLEEKVEAEWRLDGETAVIEMARASGLDLVGGPERNRPLEATTAGTGELIGVALAAGAKRIIVGLGGSATTDGGRGCLEAIRPHARFAAVELIAACDVETRFIDAAAVFAPQKGATPSEVGLLTRRLERLAQDYEREHAVDVTTKRGSGAAGGLGGALAAIGAELISGFDLVADLQSLPERIEVADFVVTAEGFLDAQSFEGKVVGGVIELAEEAGVGALVVVGGEVDEDARAEAERRGAAVVSLSERYGFERSMRDPLTLTSEVVAGYLRSVQPRR